MSVKVVLKQDLPHILNISTTPTPIGNTVGRGHFVKDAKKDMYFIDIDGKSVLVEPYTLTTEWEDAVLLNGFVPYGGSYTKPRFRVLNDVLQVQGLVKGGAAGSRPIFKLPPNIANRVVKRSIHAVDRSGSANGRIDINSNGVLAVNISTSWTSIETSRALD